MKSNLLLCIFLIVFSTAFSSKSKLMELEEGFADLVKTDLGKLIYQFTELQVQTGGRYTGLFKALDVLRDSLIDHRESEKKQYLAESSSHDNLVVQFNGQLKSAKEDILTNNNYLKNVLKPSKEDTVKAIKEFFFEISC